MPISPGNVFWYDDQTSKMIVSGLFRSNGEEKSRFNPNTKDRSQARGVLLIQKNNLPVIVPTDEFNPEEWPIEFFPHAIQAGPIAIIDGKINDKDEKDAAGEKNPNKIPDFVEWYNEYAKRATILGIDSFGNLHVKHFWGKDILGQTAMRVDIFIAELEKWKEKNGIKSALCVDAGSKGFKKYWLWGIPVAPVLRPAVGIYGKPKNEPSGRPEIRKTPSKTTQKARLGPNMNHLRRSELREKEVSSKTYQLDIDDTKEGVGAFVHEFGNF